METTKKDYVSGAGRGGRALPREVPIFLPHALDLKKPGA